MKNTIRVQITDQNKPNMPVVAVLRGSDTIDDVLNRVVSDSEPSDGGFSKALLSVDAEFLVSVQGSSFVDILQYNFKTQKLTVHLSSGRYPYEGVSPTTFLLFVTADSKGRFYNEYFVNRKTK